jgi:hypothetical protein
MTPVTRYWCQIGHFDTDLSSGASRTHKFSTLVRPHWLFGRDIHRECFDFASYKYGLRGVISQNKTTRVVLVRRGCNVEYILVKYVNDIYERICG